MGGTGEGRRGDGERAGRDEGGDEGAVGEEVDGDGELLVWSVNSACVCVCDSFS